MIKVDAKDIKYLGFATLDNLGRPFEYNGRVYRGIYPDKVSFVEELFKSGLVDELVRQHLFVKTQISDLYSDEFPLILSHKKLLASLPTSWTYNQLRDAAIVILKVMKICNKFGYELSDAHPYNVTFDSSNPVYIDFGSIRKLKDKTIPMEEFVNFTLVPLFLISKGYLLEAYTLLHSELHFKLPSKTFRESIFFKKFLEIIGNKGDKFDNKQVTENWIEKHCPGSIMINEYWAGYQEDIDSMKINLEPHMNNRFSRFFKLPNIIRKYSHDVKSSVDLAGSSGLLSAIIEKSRLGLERIVNTDYDHDAANIGYLFTKKNTGYSYQSYLLNFMLPLQYRDNEKFKSDIVFAMAITHHLLLTQGFKIDGIFERIASFSNKYVYIEFMPLGLWGGDIDKLEIIPEWYTLDWFRSKFKSHFKLLHEVILESHIIKYKIYPHRVLFVGKLRQ